MLINLLLNLCWGEVPSKVPSTVENRTTVSKNKSSIIGELYEDADSGFSIPEEEIKKISASGSDSTYGEILPKTVSFLLRKVNVTPETVFYDLGCGVGKMVAQVHMETNAKKSVGIEMSTARHGMAMDALKVMKEKDLLDPSREVQFINHDMFNVDISDGTFFYIASTCFSDELMEKISDKLATVKGNADVVTLRPLPERSYITLYKEYNLPMTWSNETEGYHYKINNKILES